MSCRCRLYGYRRSRLLHNEIRCAGRRRGAGTGPDSGKAVPIFGLKIPSGYRDWRLVSVAHEAGSLNDIRAILGNDPAIRAYREGTQSFVAGSQPDWYLQFMVKDACYPCHTPVKDQGGKLLT